jgi:hypothetical protein
MDVNKLNDKGASYCGVDTHLLSRPWWRTDVV